MQKSEIWEQGYLRTHHAQTRPTKLTIEQQTKSIILLSFPIQRQSKSLPNRYKQYHAGKNLPNLIKRRKVTILHLPELITFEKYAEISDEVLQVGVHLKRLPWVWFYLACVYGLMEECQRIQYEGIKDWQSIESSGSG